MANKMELVFATNNASKLEEVQAMVGDKFTIRSLAAIGCTEDIPETGISFEENAKQKTDYLAAKYNRDCFGDDSGLEVYELNNEPGIYSARYAGSRDMERNIDLVLSKLRNSSNRAARFRTVISLFLRGEQYFFEGVVEGRIVHERRGQGGFGYDPIFIPAGYEHTFAEMTLEQKNQISHRAIAVAELVAFLKQ